jgi:hypothetical protein
MLFTIVRTGSILHSLNIGRAFTCHTERRETEIEKREPAVRALLAVGRRGMGSHFQRKKKAWASYS